MAVAFTTRPAILPYCHSASAHARGTIVAFYTVYFPLLVLSAVSEGKETLFQSGGSTPSRLCTKKSSRLCAMFKMPTP